MSRGARVPATRAGGGVPSPRAHVVRVAAALAAGMGVGRFVYTPILPLMHTQAGLSTDAGAHLATANYVGYLLGSLAGTLFPTLVRSRTVLRGSLLLLIGTLAAMPATHSTTVWMALRLLAGAASAMVFVVAVSSLLGHLRDHPPHLPGWGFGGVGAGIALSGLLVLALRPVADWRVAWWSSAVLAAALATAAWNLRPDVPGAIPTEAPAKGVDRHFGALFVSYTLEGVGYIVAGTFLVAAIAQSSPGGLGSGAWVLVGLAAVPSSALWARLGRRWSRPGLLYVALLIQAVGIALPALVDGVAAALVSALLFGATFIGVSTLALATGAELRFPRSVALLTAGYSVGQILGPLTVAPLLHHGYRPALLLAALVVLAAAVSAAVLRIGFPHHAAAVRHSVPDQARRPAPTDAGH
ncbi:YbfB/YjiJ family MFS transporter [Streptomyces sp. MBT65]|uniref:YbfB/YjiJ family MFS transporter n=1 Tax=Streptomyces sp. MBT65 TaxID=1488395 RepID=UPI00190BB209|nr:YbfB/YjiJ family MFS transporter [Streptomyces sp. MBT65]MBK3578309.1 YbfB/YjiJ family MFS transporter [Streptomyces sp. MBT65]